MDEQGSEILSDTCTCPAYQKYWGMCKHCVAVLLAYIEWRKERRLETQRQIALEQISYGVNFSFLHCIEAFTPECRPMVRYLVEQSRERKTMYQSPYG